MCSLVFVLGTAAQALLVIDIDLMAHAMRLAGTPLAQAEREAPGLVAALRATGVAHLLGNAVGLLALTGASVGERADCVHELDDRTGPAMGEHDRTGVRAWRPRVQRGAIPCRRSWCGPIRSRSAEAVVP